MIPEDNAKAEPQLLRHQNFPAKGVTKVKSHGVYELKPSIVAKSTQVTMTPSLGLHLTSPKNASLGLGKLESAEP